MTIAPQIDQISYDEFTLSCSVIVSIYQQVAGRTQGWGGRVASPITGGRCVKGSGNFSLFPIMK